MTLPASRGAEGSMLSNPEHVPHDTKRLSDPRLRHPLRMVTDLHALLAGISQAFHEAKLQGSSSKQEAEHWRQEYERQSERVRQLEDRVRQLEAELSGRLSLPARGALALPKRRLYMPQSPRQQQWNNSLDLTAEHPAGSKTRAVNGLSHLAQQQQQQQASPAGDGNRASRGLITPLSSLGVLLCACLLLDVGVRAAAEGQPSSCQHAAGAGLGLDAGLTSPTCLSRSGSCSSLDEQASVLMVDDGGGVGATAAAAVSVALAKSWAVAAGVGRAGRQLAQLARLRPGERGGCAAGQEGGKPVPKPPARFRLLAAVPRSQARRARLQTCESRASLFSTSAEPDATDAPASTSRDAGAMVDPALSRGHSGSVHGGSLWRGASGSCHGGGAWLQGGGAGLGTGLGSGLGHRSSLLFPSESVMALDSLIPSSPGGRLDDAQEATWRASGSHLKLQWLSQPSTLLLVYKPAGPVFGSAVRTLCWLLRRGLRVFVEPSVHAELVQAVEAELSVATEGRRRSVQAAVDSMNGGGSPKGAPAKGAQAPAGAARAAGWADAASSGCSASGGFHDWQPALGSPGLADAAAAAPRSAAGAKGDPAEPQAPSSPLSPSIRTPGQPFPSGSGSAASWASGPIAAAARGGGPCMAALAAARPPRPPPPCPLAVSPPSTPSRLHQTPGGCGSWLSGGSASSAPPVPPVHGGSLVAVEEAGSPMTPPPPHAVAGIDLAAQLCTWDPCGCCDNAIPSSVASQLDLVVTLGGDGTVLWTCSMFANGAVPPIVPFAMGSLGFMTPFSIDGMETVLSRCTSLDHGLQLMLRHRLQCRVLRGDKGLASASDLQTLPPPECGEEVVVLNEVVIDRGATPCLCNLQVYVDQNLGDGMIVATPTGSTAYSLAAGGSMVHPGVPALLFTPICPHTIASRALVLPEHVMLRVKVPLDSRAEAYCSFDGHGRQQLRPGDSVLIRLSPWPAPMVCSMDASHDWFLGVREGLHWNLRKLQAGKGN